MPDKYLYDRLAEEFGKRTMANIQLPQSLTDNLSPRYELRPYQVDAFQRFLCYYKSDFAFKKTPSHLLFNMATGSGKTLLMAGLILYLYEQGYRNFLFFVNSVNLIEKTRDNFLNQASVKYQFNQTITIANRRVIITPVDNFEAVNPNDINICFTTIQQLHTNLNTPKENAITFEDFRKHKVVLLADEAHHLNVKTKSQVDALDSWENTVEKIFKKNTANLLLEFTATHDYDSPELVDKYRDKVIMRYDLLQFRNDRYSKDIVIVQADLDLNERILQALILSQYKQAVAAEHNINLKPVILFKAQHTIAQSQENKKNFHSLIDHLSVNDIVSLRRKSDILLVQRAFRFFRERISDEQLVERLKQSFQEDYCLSVNENEEQNKYQVLVNTLEDRNNRIRAIFAVQKLNEGWDVLNLFDIVRCYEQRDTGRAKIGKTTMAEAQLIGRGARYYPFGESDRFRRKYDGDLGQDLRILEELHYHSVNDSRYITEIRSALIEQGLMDAREVQRELTLKEDFKQTDFYKYGIIWLNDRQPKDYGKVQSFTDLGVSKRNCEYSISTGHGAATIAMENGKNTAVSNEEMSFDVPLRDIEHNIIQSALARKQFFHFNILKHSFPNLNSMRDFILADDYLGGLSITFKGNSRNLTALDKLNAVLGLLGEIESSIRANATEYQGTQTFRKNRIHEVFHNKLLKFDSSNPRVAVGDGFTEFVADKNWYAFNTLYGTEEETGLVEMLDRQIQRLQTRYDSIYLLRNEGYFALYNFDDGQAFQPDFVLFLHQKLGELLTYQLFVEPKGEYLQSHDQWKEDFLGKITEAFKDKVLTSEDKNCRLIGLPFYSKEDENQFIAILEDYLEVQ